MASLNKVQLLGNLGCDPDLRFTTSGQPICRFRIATSESYTGKDGQKHSDVQWHRVVVWGKQAENCKQYLSKGRQVLVEGQLRNHTWEAQDGTKRYQTEIRANNVQFLSNGPRAKDEPSAEPQLDLPLEESAPVTQDDVTA